MAEERNLGLDQSRAVTRGTSDTDTDEDNQTKAELQRRMEEARESISQTVAEIKDTVTTQYQSVKETVTDALDWREQYRRRPVVFSVGAASLGFIVGYSIAGAFKGGEENYVSRSFNEYDEGEEKEYEPRSYAAQPITGATATSAYGRSETEASRPSYSSGYQTEYKAEPEGPGLLERFKESRAYNRLEEELGNIGNRVLDELSKTAQAVVIPLLLDKLKELIGVDASGKTEQGRSSTPTQRQTSVGTQQSGGQGQTRATQTGQTGSTPGATSTRQTPNTNEPSGTSQTTSANRATGSSTT